ncbi:DUF885 domain-containing protein [Williamsia sp. M5A3_1d]
MTGTETPRTPTEIDAIAEDFLARSCAADPVFASDVGVTDHDDQLTDHSPDAVADRTATAREALRRLAAARPVDDVDRVTVATMTAQIGRSIAVDDAGLRVGEVNVIASPLQGVRDVFDVMPVDTAEQRETMLTRMRALPASIDSIVAGLRHRVQAGPPLARRQVELVAAQAGDAASALASNIARATATGADGDADAFGAAHAAAGAAFESLREVLLAEVAPTAADADGVGRDRYLLHSAEFVGTDIDPDEAYAWGLDHLQSIVSEQETLAEQIAPGAGVAGALAALDDDPRYQMTDRDAFVAWMQELSDRATLGLAGTHFDIPDGLTALECRLAPSAVGIIYYTMPSEDLTRPGRMWWSVPPEQTVFHTWQETTTVFHEGVPGHHLQLGQAMISPDLNRWRKLASFTSGHGEGWALYAERLMDELGWLTDIGDRMGMLDSQRLRAARVVVDIGVHCGLRAPDEVGGGTWDADKAWQFLCDAVAMDRNVLRFELNRYLGWPGQAPSYALGQRVWERTRDDYLRADPDRTLRDFHSRALRLGGVSLDVLPGGVAGTIA